MENKKIKDNFKRIIQDRLELHCIEDSSFVKHYNKPNKNIDDCVKYIYGAVKKANRSGFTDDEIYSLAIHYYVEDDVKIGSIEPSQIILNQEVKLTQKEKDEIKALAKEKLLEREIAKLKKKNKPSSNTDKKDNQNTLF